MEVKERVTVELTKEQEDIIGLNCEVINDVAYYWTNFIYSKDWKSKDNKYKFFKIRDLPNSVKYAFERNYLEDIFNVYISGSRELEEIKNLVNEYLEEKIKEGIIHRTR